MKRAVIVLSSLSLIGFAIFVGIQVLIGKAVKVANHGWHVGIMASDTYKCGGTHIGNGWVLTAMHCIDYANRIGVVANTTSKPTPNSPQLGECRPEKTTCLRVKPHWGLALIFFGEKVREKVEKLPLPNATSTASGSVHAVGWGKTFSKDRLGDLRGVTMTVVNVKFCRDTGRLPVPSPGICTEGHLDGLCWADSGGSLVGGTLGTKGEFFGVVQEAEDCLKASLSKVKRYASFTSLLNKKVLEWINAEMQIAPVATYDSLTL